MDRIYEMALEMLEPVTESVGYPSWALTEISSLFVFLSERSNDPSSNVDYSNANSLNKSLPDGDPEDNKKCKLELPGVDGGAVLARLLLRKYTVDQNYLQNGKLLSKTNVFYASKESPDKTGVIRVFVSENINKLTRKVTTEVYASYKVVDK